MEVRKKVKIGCILLGLTLIGLSARELHRTASDRQVSLFVCFNSDTLTCASFYEDVVHNACPVRNYIFPTTTVMFPDCFLYFITREITGAVAPAMVSSMCAMFLLQLLGCYLLIRVLAPAADRWHLTMVLLGMGSLLILANAKSGLDNGFFRLPIIVTYHGGSLISLILGLALLIYLLQSPVWERQHRLALLALFLNTTLAVGSDRLIIPQLVAPASATFILMRMIVGGSSHGVPTRRVTLLIAVLLSGMFTGQWLLRILQPPWQDANNHYPYSLGYAWEGLRLLIDKWKEYLLGGNWLHWLVALSFTGCAIHLGYVGVRRLRSRGPLDLSLTQRGLLFASAYYVAACTVMTATVCYVGLLYNPPHYTDFDWRGAARYFLPIFFLPFYLVGIWLIPLRRAGWNRVSSAAIVGVLGFAAITLQSSSQIPRANDQAVWNYYPEFVEQLDAYAEEFDLDYGLAGYWEAKPITLFSRRGVKAHQVIASPVANSRMIAFPWLCNSRNYFETVPGRDGPPRYQFMLVNELLTVPTASRREMIANFGEPAAEGSCGPFQLLVYNRPEDVKFQEIAQRECFIHRGRYKCQVGETIRFEADTLPSMILGEFPPPERTATEFIDPSGTLSSGPHLALTEAGTYRVKMVTSSWGDCYSGEWSLGLVNMKFGTLVTEKAGKLPTGWMTETIEDISISNRQRGRLLDCRIDFNGSGSLRMHYLEVTRIR